MSESETTSKRLGSRKWTPEEEAVLVKMWPMDCSALAIAGQLKRSLVSVMRKARHLKLKKDKLPGNRVNGLSPHKNDRLDNLEEFLND